SEEGGWLYGAYKWGKDPILSVGLAGNYQSQALKNPFGNLADQQLLDADVYLNYPMGENEVVFEATAYLNKNGSGSANTGLRLSPTLVSRYGSFAPYIAYDYFQPDDCSGLSGLPAAQTTTCQNTIDTADSRNFKVGINYFINKNLNHVNLEFQENHG